MFERELFEYVLITYGFRSLFNAESVSAARSMALEIAAEKHLHAFLVYNRRGDLIMDYPER